MSLFSKMVFELDSHQAWPVSRPDVNFYDKKWVGENPNTPFLWVVNESGSTVIPLTGGCYVRFEYIRTGKLNSLPHNTHFWFSNGIDLFKITKERAAQVIAPTNGLNQFQSEPA